MSSIAELERSLGTSAVLVGGASLLAVLLLAVHGLRRVGAHRTADVVAATALLVAVAGVVLVTLGPQLRDGEVLPRRLILDPVLGATDGHGRTVWRPLVANVSLFVPVGALAAARFPGRRVQVWIAAVGLSLGVEATQYLLPIGRIANSADVLANAGGAALGVLLDRLVATVTGSGRLPRHARSEVGRQRLG